MRALGLNPTEAEVKKIVQEVDPSGEWVPSTVEPPRDKRQPKRGQTSPQKWTDLIGSTKDKMAGPDVFVIGRFHCINVSEEQNLSVLCYVMLNVLIFPLSFALSPNLLPAPIIPLPILIPLPYLPLSNYFINRRWVMSSFGNQTTPLALPIAWYVFVLVFCVPVCLIESWVCFKKWGLKRCHFEWRSFWPTKSSIATLYRVVQFWPWDLGTI